MASKHAGLDTSVVLRLLVGLPKDQARRAVAYLDRLFEEGTRAIVSDLVVAEAYYALQFHYDVPKDEALDSLRTFLCSDEIEGVGVAARVLQTVNLAKVKPGFIDRLIHQQYAKHGATMATFEHAAKKLTGTLVL